MVEFKKRVSYDEVIGYWLSFEYSDRPEMKKHIDSHFSKEDINRYVLAQNKDYADKEANTKRYEMLRSYRDFVDWFSHAEWYDAILDRYDLENLLVIHSKHWEELSNGSLRALDIAKKIDADEDGLLKTDNRRRVKKIAEDIDEKIEKHSKLIVVGPKGGKDLTVIDGVHRAIRFCLYYLVRKQKDPRGFTMNAYTGLTPDPIDYASKNLDYFE